MGGSPRRMLQKHRNPQLQQWSSPSGQPLMLHSTPGMRFLLHRQTLITHPFMQEVKPSHTSGPGVFSGQLGKIRLHLVQLHLNDRSHGIKPYSLSPKGLRPHFQPPRVASGCLPQGRETRLATEIPKHLFLCFEAKDLETIPHGRFNSLVP